MTIRSLLLVLAVAFALAPSAVDAGRRTGARKTLRPLQHRRAVDRPTPSSSVALRGIRFSRDYRPRRVNRSRYVIHKFLESRHPSGPVVNVLVPRSGMGAILIERTLRSSGVEVHEYA